MKRALLAGLMALGLSAIPSGAAAQGDCDRQCLGGKLDDFLQAVVAKDPSTAGLWVGFRQTENALLVAPGEGIWESNSGIGSVDRRYFDPDTGEAEFFGTLKEGTRLQLLRCASKSKTTR